MTIDTNWICKRNSRNSKKKKLNLFEKKLIKYRKNKFVKKQIYDNKIMLMKLNFTKRFKNKKFKKKKKLKKKKKKKKFYFF